MDLETFRRTCLALPHTTEDMPFGDDVLVFRVGNKIFAMVNLVKLPLGANLKCDPEWAAELRERYEDIGPGHYTNKRHWNLVAIAGGVPDALVLDLIRLSYDLVYASLPRKTRDALV